MNTSRGLVTAAVLSIALAGCGTRTDDARTDFPEPGHAVTLQSQPVPQQDREPRCFPGTPCAR